MTLPCDYKMNLIKLQPIINFNYQDAIGMWTSKINTGTTDFVKKLCFGQSLI